MARRERPASAAQAAGSNPCDKGVDGVFATQLGGHHAYQVKFRTGRPSLTWDELSNFIGLVDRVDRRARSSPTATALPMW